MHEIIRVSVQKAQRKKSLNSIMKIISLFALLILNTSSHVFAQSAEIKNPLGDLMTLSGLLNRFLSFLIPIAVVGFTFCILYATYVRVFSSGDSGKEKASIAIARNAAIGFFIIFMAGVALQLFAGILKIDI